MRSTAPSDPAAPRPPGRLQLTGEGLGWFGVVAVLGALGWAKGLNLILLLAYLLAALLVLNGLLARLQVRRVAAARVPSPPVYAGEETLVRVRVRNTGRGPATVGVTDPAGPPGGWLVDRLPAGAEVECADRRTFRTRGRFAHTPPVVWSGFPFGFLRSERPADPGGDVVVLPACGTADPEGLRRWVVRGAAGEDRSRKVLRRVTSDQADVRGVRPYRPGDSIRSIHWRSSARRGELMVREYDAAPSPELVLVVEPWLPADPTPADRDRLEAALSLAVTLVRTWCRHAGTGMTVVVAGGEPAVRTGPPTDVFARDAVVPLADVEGAPSSAPIGPGTFGRSLARVARLVVSSRPGCPLAADLTRATGRPFAALDPTVPLPWYQPPRGEPRARSGSEAGAPHPAPSFHSGSDLSPAGRGVAVALPRSHPSAGG